MFKLKTKLILGLVALFLFAHTVFLGDFSYWERQSSLGISKESMYLPNSKFLKVASLGFNNALADFYWVKLLVYFGEHFVYDNVYTYKEALINLVTDLDPLFYFAYYWGSSSFLYHGNWVTEDDKKKSIKILEKAHKNIKNDWRVPYYLSFNYAMELRDYKKAAEVAMTALDMPDVPQRVKRWVSYLQYKAEDREKTSYVTTRAILEEHMTYLGDNNIKENLKKRLKEFEEDASIDARLAKIEKFAKDYKKAEFSFLPISQYIMVTVNDKDYVVDNFFSNNFKSINEKLEIKNKKDNFFSEVEASL
ncbi:MAG: hypothetical protein ABIA04_08180 [Pseudomonadota bacterium]